MRRGRLVIVAVVVLALVAGGVWWIAASSGHASPDIITAGFIEATDVAISPEISGRIASIAVAEGDQAVAGATLVRLDDSLLKAQVAQAEATVAQAQATVEQVQAAVEQSQAVADQAAMASNQAATTREGTRKAWENALDVQQHPLDLNAQLVAAQGQVDIARYALSIATNSYQKLVYPYTFSTFALDIPTAVGYMTQAGTQLDAISQELKIGLTPEQFSAISRRLQEAMDNLTKSSSLLSRGQGPDVFAAGLLRASDFWTVRSAQLQMEQAQTALATATKTLQIMQDKSNNPQQIIAAVDSARAAYDTATAAAKVVDSAATAAQKQVAIAQKQVVVAQRQVDLARASLEVVRVQSGKANLVSPVSGTVASRNAEPGEMASPGLPILTISDLTTMTLTAYVPESQVGLVKLGQAVLVSVDSYPGQNFDGTVTYISPRALFTPANIQLKNEREKTVFPVKIQLPNPDHKLKPGMPADARIVVGQ